jgi:hypothetical protein
MIGHPLLPRCTTGFGREHSGELVHTSSPPLFLRAPPPLLVRLLPRSRIVEAGLARGVVARDGGMIGVVVDLGAAHRPRSRVRQVRIGMPVLPMPFTVRRVALEGTFAGRRLPRFVRPRVVAMPRRRRRRRCGGRRCGCRRRGTARALPRARTTSTGVRPRAPSGRRPPPRARRASRRCCHARIQRTGPV